MSLEEFYGYNFSPVEQHNDFWEAHKVRDTTYIAKSFLIPCYRKNHVYITMVMEDYTITYSYALAVGKQAMAEMVCKPFTDVKLSRKDQVLPLVSMTCSSKIHDDKIVIVTFRILRMITISKQIDEDLKMCLQHELT
ncbi:hypothetical protein PR048_005268 [Dryococelus australis]|uniref:Uncharacterized protein n=1 Tax=Dryococelus australis TaxID=614101 RepID=A0ABQ9I882_9NEOP|nr:hypothetical protein PR048_005268 [Dryococelus australis]